MENDNNLDEYNTTKYYIDNLLKQSINYNTFLADEEILNEPEIEKIKKNFLIFDLGAILGKNAVFNGDTHHAHVLREIIIKIINNYAADKQNEYINFMFFTKKISGNINNYTHSNTENNDNNIHPIPIKLESTDLNENIKLQNIDISFTYISNFRKNFVDKQKMNLFKDHGFRNDNDIFNTFFEQYPDANIIESLKEFEYNYRFIMGNLDFHIPTRNMFSHLKPLFEKLHAITTTDDACAIRRYLILKNNFKDDKDYKINYYTKDFNKILNLNIDTNNSEEIKLIKNKNISERFSECEYFFGNESIEECKNNYTTLNNLINNFNDLTYDVVFDNDDIQNIQNLLSKLIWEYKKNENCTININKNKMIDLIINRNFIYEQESTDSEIFNLERNEELFSDILKAYLIEKIFFDEYTLSTFFTTFIPPIEENNVFYNLVKENEKIFFKVRELDNNIFNNIYINFLKINN